MPTKEGGWCVVDGRSIPLAEASIPVDDPAFTTGWAVFETLTVGSSQHRVLAHLKRLSLSASAAGIEMPSPPLLGEEIALAASHVAGPSRVRITLTGGGRRVVTAVPLELSRRHRPVRAVTGPWREEPYLHGAVKHTSRAPWVVAVLRSGVDEVLLVDGEGRFTEGTTCGIAAVIAGVLWTAPHDGRILESTTVCELVVRAEELGIEVRRQGPPATGPFDGLYVCSTTRELAPVVELDGRPLPGWEPVGRRLAPGASEQDLPTPKTTSV